MAPMPTEPSLWSGTWKDITLKIFGTDEKLIIPVVTSAKVWEVKTVLAEMIGDTDPGSLEFMFKLGPSYKRHRNGDEIQSTVVVKGIRSFARHITYWPHPFCLVGAGHFGLRQAMHYIRYNIDYTHFERKPVIGGNAWAAIANPTSRLQSEGPQYQLQYDIFEGNVANLLPVSKYQYWPTRDEILAHLKEISDQWGVTANLKLSTEIVEMKIVEPYEGCDMREKTYDMYWKSRVPGDDSEGVFRCSCLAFYPGCLVIPHRKIWPGEEIFGGQIGYGFSSEFNYHACKGQDAVIIGMGAFSHENVRTFVEHGGRKVYNIVRHFNLMLPRLICWWMNQSSTPPTAALCLDAMKPMYDLLGWDPWSFFSVTANADRTVATIKQYTRWGISDVYFLALYMGKAEVINAEVKRFKKRSAVLTTGRVVTDIDHVIKVLGFDGDFGVDKIMKTKVHVGLWPDGDWRRFVISDNSAIDASRFASVALSPPGCTFSNVTLWYHQHPGDAIKILNSGLLPENKPLPELGSPAYHYTPRVAAAFLIALSTFCPELIHFEELNNKMKKASMWALADPDTYCKACEADWYHYCKMFQEQGVEKEWPKYPYDPAFAHHLVKLEDQLYEEEVRKYAIRHKPEQELAGKVLEPGASVCLEPARRVIAAAQARRCRQQGHWEVKRIFEDDTKELLAVGHQMCGWISKYVPSRSGSPPRSRPAIGH